MEIQWMSTTVIAVQFTTIQWNTIVHILVLSLDNLTLYNLVNCQSAHQSQLKMLASVLCYTFREIVYTNISTDVQYITTLKHITVQEEILWWANDSRQIIKKCVWRLVFYVLWDTHIMYHVICIFCVWSCDELVMTVYFSLSPMPSSTCENCLGILHMHIAAI